MNMSRPYGEPKTEEERAATHEALYGSSGLPPRGSGITNYGVLNRIAAMIGSGLIKFVNLVVNANRDYPLHDYHKFVDTDEPIAYTVGTDNLTNGGDQKKRFTSKSTLLFATQACTVRFNNSNNVTQDILANTWYEFYQNIHTLIVVTIGSQGILYAYFEGTLPEEARLGA